MYNIKKSRLYFVILLSVLALVSMFFALHGFMHTNATDYAFRIESDIPDDLVKGETFNVPDGYFGEEKAICKVYSPDGEEIQGKNISLDFHGNYKIVYSATIDNVDYVQEETMYVYNPSYSFSGDKSSAEYTAYDDNAKRSGLLVNLLPNETFYYNGVIDFNAYNHSPAFKFTISPQKLGQFDSQVILFTFTDVCDPNNKIQVKYAFTEGSIGRYSFWQTCLIRANNQSWKGWDYTRAEPYLWTNTYGNFYELYPDESLVYQGTEYGQILERQFVGCWLDTDSNEFYTYYYSNKSGMVVETFSLDLDDSSYQEKLFNGLTTGKVYLSISCDKYYTSSSNVLLLDLSGNKLSSEYIRDKVAPEITVDGGNSLGELKGVKNCTYPLLNATATDNMDGYVKVHSKVYYNYSRAEGVYNTKGGTFDEEINVVNGAFNTDKAGNYSIVYYAEDYSGNYTENVYPLIVENGNATVSDIVLEDGYAVTCEKNNSVSLAKVKSFINNYDNISNGYGASYSYKVYFNSVSDSNLIKVNGDEINGYRFTPTKSGNYIAQLTIENYVGQKASTTYNINVAEQTNATFEKEPELPEYLVSGVKYVLPEVYGKTLGGQKQTASIKITDGNGERNYIAGSQVEFTSDSNGKAKLTYYFGTNTREYILPVINVKNGNEISPDKYFICNNLTASHNDKGVKLEFNGKSDAKFINAVNADGLSTTFTMDGFGDNFASICFVLTDSVDKSQKINVSFVVEGDSINVYANGVLKFKNYKKVSDGIKNMTIMYDVNTESFILGSTNRIEMRSTVYKKAFSGFTSKKAYIAFEFDDVNANSSINVTKICNQDMGSIAKNDNRTPLLSINGTYGVLYRTIGDEFDIYAAVASDVLSPYTKCVLSVTYDYGAISATDGTLLSDVNCVNGKEYKVKFDKYGTYTVSYRATDWKNRRSDFSFSVVVVDLQAPTVSINGSIPTETGIGDITLPEITATDNTANAYIMVTVINPESKAYYFSKSLAMEAKTFNASVAGIYTVIVDVMDDLGNSATQVFKINVR